MKFFDCMKLIDYTVHMVMMDTTMNAKHQKGAKIVVQPEVRQKQMLKCNNRRTL